MSIYTESYTALVLILYLSLPAVLAASGIGLIVGLLQALTQIQDQTIQHALKLIGVVVVIVATASWAGGELLAYTERIFDSFPAGR
ncbi:MAG: type III secretion system export apparatus subunit SctS [Pseudomonadota bacterium]